jgi:cysteine desulfurase
MPGPTIYFDYNATTPPDAGVRAAIEPFLTEIWGNPSSVHHVGQKARAFLDEARDRTAAVFQCKPSEVIFTSGGTESNNLAIIGTARSLKSKGRHLITSAIEHHAVLHSCEYLARKEGFELTVLPVTHDGFIEVDTLAKALRDDTILVSLMAANNEIGSLQPVAELGALCRERGVLFHTDAVQWFGKEPFQSIDQFNADLVSICAHKFHGPKGAGALFVRSPLHPDPLLFGGNHENERRAGTENLPAIMGFAEALERFARPPVFSKAALQPMIERLRKSLQSLEGARLVSPARQCLCNTLAFVVEGADSISLLAGLDMEGVCASSGSACSAGSIEPSHVVSAMGFEASLAHALVRLSLGRHSTVGEVEEVERILPDVISRVRRSSRTSREYSVNALPGL